MKQFIAIVLFYALVAASPVIAADLKASESSIEFGNVEEGPPVEKTITLTNITSGPVTIENTVTSCSCTTVTLSKTTLAPDETAELSITYQTFKYPGKFDKTIYIFTGPESENETIIHITGNVVPASMGVIGMEKRKTEVGDLALDKGNKVQITIKNEGDAPLTISRIYSSKFETEYFNAEKSGSIKIPAGQEQKVELVVTPREPGRFLDIVFIYSDARNDIGEGYKALLSGTAK